jgi:cell division protein FtsA
MARDKIIAGIDVGSNKVTTVVATLDADNNGQVIGVSTVPSAGLRKGQVVDIEAAVAAISSGVDAAERMAGISIGSAFISVGGAHIQSQNSKGVVAVAEPEGEITSVDIKRVTDAARAISIPSSREIIHVVPRGFVVDGQEGIKDPVGMTGVRLEVETQIVTGATTTIRNLAKCISEIGIDIDGLVFSGLASSYSVLTETEKELGVILVDIGAGTTDVAIYVDGALSYSSVIPVGAKNVTNDLAIGLRVSLESAEKIKLALAAKPKFAVEKTKEEDELDVTGLDLSEEIKKISRKTLIEGIIKPRLSEIFTYVGMELQKSNLSGLTPSGIVITGGGSETIGLLDTARSRLVMPCRIGFPTGLSGLVDEISKPMFATAYGLILYAKEENPVRGGTSSLPKFSGFGSIAQKLPLKNLFGRVVGFLKNFLP